MRITRFPLATFVLLSATAAFAAVEAHSGDDHSGASVYILTQTGNASRPYSFEPPEVEVQVGQPVLWYNVYDVDHTVTSADSAESRVPNGIFNQPITAPGQTFQHLFTATGEYYYFCQNHTNMSGTVIVLEAPPTPTGTGEASDSPAPGPILALLGPLTAAFLARRR